MRRLLTPNLIIMIPIKSMFWTTMFWLFVFFWWFLYLRLLDPMLTSTIFGIDAWTWSNINIEELSTKLETISTSVSNIEQLTNDNKSTLDIIIDHIQEEKTIKEIEKNNTDNNIPKESDMVDVQTWTQVATWTYSE